MTEKYQQMGSGREILVVEDDLEVSKAVCKMLDKLGYVPIPCSQAREAFDYIKMQNIELILLDYRMPEITGLDLILMLKEMNCKIPVIMMTGYAATEDRVAFKKLEKLTILRKPIVPALLASVIEQNLAPIT